MASIYLREKVWWILYYQNGKRIRKPIGRNEKEALIFKKEVEYKLAKGLISEKGSKTCIDPVSVEKAKAEFMRKKGIYVRSKTLQNYEGILDKFSGWLTAKEIISLDQVTKEVIEDYISDRSDENSKKGGKIRDSTLSLELKSIKCFLKACAEMGLTNKNESRDIKPIRCQKRLPFFFSHEHLAMILNSREPAYYKKLYLFLLMTGMRAGEICNLHHDDIDLEHRRIYIREKPDWKPKTGERMIPISEELAELIGSIEKIDKKYVFVNQRGKKLTVHALDMRFIRLRNAIGLEKGSLHTFRHTYGANITMKTGNMRALQMLLGHQKIETTQIYSHLLEENLKKVVDQQNVGIATILATMKKEKHHKRRLSY